MNTRYFELEAPERIQSWVGEAADRCLEAVAGTLEVGLHGWNRAPLRVGPVASGVSAGVVCIEMKAARGSFSEEAWLELLLRHELAHLVIGRAWGMAPALFWEGVPVALGDAAVRERVLGIRYAAWCAALLRLGKLVPLAELVLPSAYYARRTDARIDLQAGTFCEWLLESGRLDGLRTLFRSWTPPSRDHPVVDLAPVRASFGVDLCELERLWHASLEEELPDAAGMERFRSFEPPARRAPHCDFCLTRMEGEICPACAGRSGVVVVWGT